MRLKNVGTYPINIIEGRTIAIGDIVDVELSEEENRVFVEVDKVLQVVEKAEKTKRGNVNGRQFPN